MDSSYNVLMKTGVDIRIGRPEDAASIADLGARTFIDYFGAVNEPEHIERYLEESFNLAKIEADLADPCTAFLLACQESAHIGYAKLRLASTPTCVLGPKPIELERIYVEKPYVGSGVGAMLMDCVIGKASELRRKTLWLGVWEKNQRARNFYRRYGFVEVGKKDFMLGLDRQTDLVMVSPI